MKKTEAIEYIKKNCYGEWCEDDWREAMDMAIEALKCSETPKSSEQNAETAQNAQDEDLISRKAAMEAICTEGTRLERNGTVAMVEIKQWCIDILEALPSAQPELSSEIQDILEYLDNVLHLVISPDHWNVYSELHDMISMLPSAQLDNQTNLCDSCDYLYPECPSEKDDVIFGNGIGNDNICACNKYKPSAQPERKRGKWIPVTNGRGEYECCECRCYAPSYPDGVEWLSDFCPSCGADMRGGNIE